MWVLKSIKEPGQKYYLVVGRDTIVGRKETRILILNDQSISRKHSVLTVSHSEANVSSVQRLSTLELKDSSKYGTFINGKKVESGSTTSLKDGDTVVFGSLKTNEWKVCYEPMVVCSSCLDSQDKKSLKAVLVKLGAHLLGEWTKDCTLLAMSKLNVTVKVISALITCHPMVKPEYFHKVLEAAEQNSDLPDVKEYIPPLTDMAIKKDSVSFTVDERRKTIFQDMTFIFLSPKQFKRLNQTVSFGDGKAILMEEGSDDDNDDVLVQPGTCVMYADPQDNTQNYSQNGKEWISHVKTHLKSNNLRPIQDSELGLAVLHCSCELHCNPTISQAGVNLLQPLPSQTLESQQILATETEPSQSHFQTQSRQKDFAIPSTSESVTSGRLQDRSQKRAKIKQERVSGNQGLSKDRYSESFGIAGTTSNVSKISETVLSSKDNSDSLKVKTSPGKGMITSYFGAASKKRVRQEDEEDTSTKESKTKLMRHDTYEFQSQNTQQEQRSPRMQSKKIKQEVVSPREELQTETDDYRETNIQPLNKTNDTKKEKLEIRNRAPSPVDAKITKQPNDSRDKVSVKVKRKRQDVCEESEEEEESQWSKKKNVRQTGDGNQASQSLEIPVYTETRSKPRSGEIPAGYITTTRPIEEQIDVNINMEYKAEENLPSSLVVTKEKSLVVRRPKPRITSTIATGDTVKNFKKFKKASYPGINSLPRIIGGNDLEVHNNRPHREVEEWFQEQVQVDGKEEEENSMANDLFNWEPKKKGRRR